VACEIERRSTFDESAWAKVITSGLQRGTSCLEPGPRLFPGRGCDTEAAGVCRGGA